MTFVNLASCGCCAAGTNGQLLLTPRPLAAEDHRSILAAVRTVCLERRRVFGELGCPIAIFTDNVRRDKKGLIELLTDIFPLAMQRCPALVVQDVIHRRWAFDKAMAKNHVDSLWAEKDNKAVFGRLLYVRVAGLGCTLLAIGTGLCGAYDSRKAGNMLRLSSTTGAAPYHGVLFVCVIAQVPLPTNEYSTCTSSGYFLGLPCSILRGSWKRQLTGACSSCSGHHVPGWVHGVCPRHDTEGPSSVRGVVSGVGPHVAVGVRPSTPLSSNS
jgi:hypothetical protein